MRRVLHPLLALAAAVSLSAQAAGPTKAAPVTVTIDALGPQVGQHVPGFTLPDQHGQPHSLASILGPKGAMLVFFRSADW